MAVIGKWTGGAKAQGNLPESWTAPTNLFDVQQRNDSSAYSFNATTSTLTLPSSGLANGYLVIGAYIYVDTSNGRFQPQARFARTAGTGNFVSALSSGYNRDSSEDTSYVRTWAFIDNPKGSSEIQFQWKADSDDSTGGTSMSVLEVIPFYYSDIGLFSSTSAAVYGGITPNQVTGFSGTNGTNISLSGNTVTVTGDNKRYLCLGGTFLEGTGSGRTQRWGGFRIDGSKADYAKGYTYYRNGSNDEGGEMFTTLIETATADRTLDVFIYRGDGVGSGQGGADADGGSTPSVGNHSMVVIELEDNAEVFNTIDDTGGIDLNVTGPVDQVLCRTTGVQFNDSGSFTRASDTAMNAEQGMDALFGANISAAQTVVGTTSRWTAGAKFTVNGSENNDTEAGDYLRNNQGSIDTFGWSANLMSYLPLSSGDDIGVSVQELAGGGDGGSAQVQPNWGGFWGINLDTLEASGGGSTEQLNGSISSNSTVSGNLSIASTTKSVSGQSDGSTELNGNLTISSTTKQLGGNISSSSSVNGNIGIVSTTKQLSANASGATSLNGDIAYAQTTKQISGVASGTSSMSGNIGSGTKTALGGNVSSSSSLGGELGYASTVKTISGQSTSASSLSGVLSGKTAIQGNASGQSTTQGQLTYKSTIASIEGAIQGGTTIDANLTFVQITLNIAGVSNSSTSVTGDVDYKSLAKLLEGLGVGLSTLTGDLTDTFDPPNEKLTIVSLIKPALEIDGNIKTSISIRSDLKTELTIQSPVCISKGVVSQMEDELNIVG